MEKSIKEYFKKLIRWQYSPLLVLLIVILGLHLATITNPANPLFDEIHYVPDARRVLTGEGTQRTEHPPLAKLIIVGGIEFFGDNPWGWRLPAILLSTVALAAFYDICRRLGTSHKTAFMATMLLGLDNLMFIHSGMAMLDIFLVVLTIFAFWCYLKGPRWWWLSAISIGMAGLCKFSGVLAIIPIGLHWFIIGYKPNMGMPAEKPSTTAITQELELVAVLEPNTIEVEQIGEDSFVTPIPADSVTMAETPAQAPETIVDAVPRSFWQMYSRPIAFIASMMLAPITFFLFYGIFEMIIWNKWIPFIVWDDWNQGILGTIKNALSATESLKFNYEGASPARPWEWILSPSGSLYFFDALIHPANYTDKGILLAYWNSPSYTGMVNPSIWLGGLLTIPYAIWKAFKKNNAAIFTVCWIIGTWLTWVPMFLSTNRITYIFYYLPTLGAIALGLALILTGWLNKSQSSTDNRDKYGLKLATISFILVHLLSFCILSPLRLWISVPTCALLLLFTLIYLGLGKRFTIQFVIAACISSLIMRFGLYWPLKNWLVRDAAPWDLPGVPSLWAVSILIGLILTWLFFVAMQRFARIALLKLRLNTIVKEPPTDNHGTD